MQIQREWNYHSEQTVKPTGFDIIQIKPVKSESFQKFMHCFHTAFCACPYKEMSPAFVEWSLREAHELLDGKTVNRNRPLNGGWSGVMHHNGGEWPLVSAVIEYFISSSSKFSKSQHQHFLCHLQMNILDTTKKELLPLIQDTSTSYDLYKSYVDKIMIMMESIARKATEELSGIYSVKDIEKCLSESQKELGERISLRWVKHASMFQLPDLCDYKLKYWSIHVNSEAPKTEKTIKTEQFLELSKSNIDLLQIFTTEDIAKLIQYVEILEEHRLKDTPMVISLAVTNIENFVFGLSSHLSESNNELDIASVEQLVNKYRLWNRQFLQCMTENSTKGSRHGLVVEILSNEMLVMWLGFALVHKTLKQQFPILGEYGVSLKWENVSHLVLSKEVAQRASLEVSAYLKKNSQTDNELFNLSGAQETTLKFALHFASQSDDLKKIWQEEHKAANKREEDRWEEIKRKKNEVERLKKKLNNQENQRDSLKSKRESYDYWSRKYDELTDSIKELDSAIRSTESCLSSEKIPPDPIFQPLPRDEESALRILFFLHMPEVLKILSRLAISAQQILCPIDDFCRHSALDSSRVAEIDKKMRQDSFASTSWVRYYNEHSNKVATCKIILHPYSMHKPPKLKKVGPKNVEDFYSKSQCVWHPDSLQPVILWQGGGFPLDERGGYHFNPFVKIDNTSLIEYFTEKFDQNIQFTLIQLREDTDSRRSNQPVANQKLKPSCFKKYQWLTFANLRAYPNQQLRKICSILNDRSLPLSEPIVHTLLRQTLYHLGEVEDRGGVVFPVWKTDMLGGQFLQIMHEELKNLGDEIASKPSQQQCMWILIEITRFVAQWSDQCVSLLRSFHEKIEKWVLACDAQIEQAHVNDLPTLRAKKGVFYHYQIFCLSRGKLSNDDIAKLLECLVNAQNESKFKDETSYDEQLRTMIQKRHYIMSELVADIVQKVNRDPSRRMLTKAIRKIISHAPSNLNWTNILSNNRCTCCFEARDSSNNLYSINLLNGMVLYNGTPPSQLPTAILIHPLYRRSFGDRNFETCSSTNVLKTVKATHGFYYWFCLQGNNLCVTEKDPRTGHELLMMDSCCLPDQGCWGYDLPINLKENYSHWYSPQMEVILFRGREFFDRDVDFILEMKRNQWHCYRIPSHRKKKIWNEHLEKLLKLEEQFDELVKIEAPVLKILHKFEAEKYLHCYKSPEGFVRYHYTRFDLEFYFDPKLALNSQFNLKSRDYTGYKLSINQQLHDTLLGFERYLVLEHETYHDIKIIIPEGAIVVGSRGITVQNEDSPASQLKVYAYAVHPRFCSLTATSIHARIHLADLYAACSTLVPEGRMKMCGSEVAMQLLRRSWTNQPLERADYAKLKNMCINTNFTPALELLTFEVSSSSLQAAFLHTHIQEAKLDEQALIFPEAAAIEYNSADDPKNVRKSLTVEEVLRVFGRTRLPETKKVVIQEQFHSTCCAHCVQRQNDETKLFESLLVLMTKEQMTEKTGSMFGFNNRFNSNDFTDLYKHMIQKLEESHDAYNQLTKMVLKTGYNNSFISLSDQIVSKRKEIESSLIESLTLVSDYCGNRAINFRILRSVNVYPLLSLEDVLQIDSG